MNTVTHATVQNVSHAHIAFPPRGESPDWPVQTAGLWLGVVVVLGAMSWLVHDGRKSYRRALESANTPATPLGSWWFGKR